MKWRRIRILDALLWRMAMSIAVHALGPEAFMGNVNLEPFAKVIASELEACSVISVLPVSEESLVHLEDLIRKQGLEVRRVLLQLASEMSLSKISLGERIVYICESYDEIRAAQAGARIAANLPGSVLMLWSVSDFLRTVDSSVDENAEIIPALSYGDAFELFSFQKKSAIAEAIRPVTDKGMSIRYRCLKEPGKAGTLIAPAKALKPFYGVKCICGMKNLTLVSIDEVDRELSSKVFKVMDDAGIDYQLIARAGGDGSLTFSVSDSQATACRLAIKGLFPSYQASFKVKSQANVAIVTALGEGMARMSDTCGRFFGALGAAQVLVKAFSQGLYEQSISAAIDENQLPQALKALNATFFEHAAIAVQPEIKNVKELFIGIFGIGNVGSILMERIKQFNDYDNGMSIVVFYIANSKKCLVDVGGIDIDDWRRRFDEEAVDRNPELLIKGLSILRQKHQIAMVDCTASTEIPSLYPKLMASGINVILANKLGVSLDQATFDAFSRDARLHNTHFCFEATVGAGLPIIRTVKDMLSYGERIDRFEGALSGTLTWILGQLSFGRSFSALVAEAIRRGYCEPDPRSDLSGLDSGRKAVILSHIICPGHTIDDVRMESLFPPELAGLPLDEFLEALPSLDEGFKALAAKAAEKSENLRYITCVSRDGELSCGLRIVPASSPLSYGGEEDCISVLYTEHYVNGMSLIGKGAGPGVTSNALMADICSIIG